MYAPNSAVCYELLNGGGCAYEGVEMNMEAAMLCNRLWMSNRHVSTHSNPSPAAPGAVGNEEH